MNNVSITSARAFESGQNKRIANTISNGNKLYLFNNLIAEYREDGLYITNAGWKTKTTKERLNALSGVNIVQKKKVWYLNGEEWDGAWIKINSCQPPRKASLSDGKEFILETKWEESGYRGYEYPVYSVCGASDTGMWEDSPCRSDVAKQELDAATTALKKEGIPVKLMTLPTSNVFCVHHYLVTPPFYVSRAREVVSVHIDSVETNLLYLTN